jgi:hypothetical protein
VSCNDVSYDYEEPVIPLLHIREEVD